MCTTTAATAGGGTAARPVGATASTHCSYAVEAGVATLTSGAGTADAATPNGDCIASSASEGCRQNAAPAATTRRADLVASSSCSPSSDYEDIESAPATAGAECA